MRVSTYQAAAGYLRRVISTLLTIICVLTVAGTMKTASTPLASGLALTLTSPGGPWASSDEMLAGLQLPSSPAVVERLNALPPGALVIVTPGDQLFLDAQLLYTLSYLAVPRPVYLYPCSGNFEIGLTPPPTTVDVGGILLYRLPPHEVDDGYALSPQATLLPVTKTTAWTSYCRP